MVSEKLVKGIRRWDLVALGINFIVGAGIVALPSRIYRLAGPATLIAYGVCAAAVILIVLCFAEVGSRFTQTGGPYLYAREAFGPFVAFEVGWLRWLSGVTSFAVNSHIFVDNLSYLWPAVDTGLFRSVVIIALVLSFTAVNVIGVRDTAVISNFFILVKLTPLLLFVVVGLYFVEPQNFSSSSPVSYNNFSESVMLLIYAFTGFESITIPAAEVRDPQRSIPFALFTTISIVTLLYVSVQTICIGTLPGLAESTRPLVDASHSFLGMAGGYVMSVTVLLSIAGNSTGQLLHTPRLLFAMAEQGQLPQSFALIHDKYRTPYVSILFSACIVLGLALSGTFSLLLAVSVIARIAMYAATCTALPILRRKGNVLAATFKLPGGIVIAIVSVALCLWMLSTMSGEQAVMASIGVGVGLVLYLTNRRRRATSPTKAEV